MPHIPTLPYHEFPDLHPILDFLRRCEADGQYMNAAYNGQPELQAGEAACRRLHIYPRQSGIRYRHGDADGRLHLRVSRADWHVLSKHVFSMLEIELHQLFQATSQAAQIMPLPWDALPLADSALAAWGMAERMVALPLQAASVFLEYRYPANAPQRRPPARMDDVGQASACQRHPVPGFLVATQDGTDYLACHEDDWRKEVASAGALLEHHSSLILKIGLQLLAAGDASPLPAMSQTLAHMDKTVLLMELRDLLQTYGERLAARATEPDPLEEALLHECLATYREWQAGHIAALLDTLPTPAENSIEQPAVSVGPLSDPDQADRLRETLAIPGRPSAFRQVMPCTHAVDPRTPARKRKADLSPGGDMKRSRLSLDRLCRAGADDKHATPGPGDGKPVVRPVILVIPIELPALREPEQSRFEAPTAAINMQPYQPPGVGMGESHGQALSRSSMTMLAAMPRVSAPVRTVQMNTQPEAWRQSLVTAKLFEPRMYRPAGAAAGTRDAPVPPAAHGPEPAKVQIYSIPVGQKAGLKI